MNSCHKYHANLQRFLDKELSTEDHEDFRLHLQECEACRTKLAEEEDLSGLLRRTQPLYSTPDGLRQRVIQAMGESASPVHSHAFARVWSRFSNIVAAPFQSPGPRPFNWPAVATATVLVVVGLLLVRRSLLQSRADNYIEMAVEAHRASLTGNPLEVQSASPSVVTTWFDGKVPFHFRLPSSPEESKNEQVYQLAGGGLVNYKGRAAALVSYRMQQQRISLLVDSSKSAVAAGGEEVPSGGIEFHYHKQASFNVITWSNHGLTYALVSSLPGTGRQSCLVCHQYMANSAPFSAHR
jgi:anti-sigma factor (TIGR02949 family)